MDKNETKNITKVHMKKTKIIDKIRSLLVEESFIKKIIDANNPVYKRSPGNVVIPCRFGKHSYTTIPRMIIAFTILKTTNSPDGDPVFRKGESMEFAS